MAFEPHSDKDKITTRYNYFWIHNVFGNFAKDTLEYFSDYLYPRFEWKIVSTYDKAVEYLNKQIQFARETDQPNKPALILDPSGDFGFDENYGKMPYRFPNLAPGMVKYVYSPIYQDSNILISLAFGRLVGEFNFTALVSSFYEYTDMRVYLNLIFGGENRFIYPRWFNSFIILPSDIYDYQYTNDVTGVHYKINIDDTEQKLVRTTNTNEVVYPCTILPRYKLTGMSDASTRLGSVDGLPEWKLGFTISYEIEIPTYIVLETDYLAEKLKINISYGSCYTENKIYSGDVPPDIIDSFESEVYHGLDDTSNSTITFPDEAVISNKKTRQEKTRYFHVVTQADVDATSVVEITLPEVVSDKELLLMFGKYGIFSYGDDYTINTTGTILTILKENVTLELGDILEIYIYEYI